MKIKEIKKYLIGFILGISLIVSIVYAADPGSIGALFTTDGSGNWVLKGENIQDNSVVDTKLKDGIISETKLTSDVQTKINKAGITNISQLINDSGYIKTGDDVEVKSLKINGELLQKKFAVVDQTWYPILSFCEGLMGSYCGENKSSYKVEPGKYIAAITIVNGSLNNSSDCSMFVDGKLGLSVSYKKNINSINSISLNSSFNNYKGDLTWNSTKVFDLKNLINSVSSFGQEFSYGSYISPGTKYLEGGDVITLYHNADYTGRKNVGYNIWGINCSVSVQYGEFIY